MVALQRAEAAAVGAGSFTASAATAARVAKGMVINNTTNLTVNAPGAAAAPELLGDVIEKAVHRINERTNRRTVRTSAPATAR